MKFKNIIFDYLVKKHPLFEQPEEPEMGDDQVDNPEDGEEEPENGEEEPEDNQEPENGEEPIQGVQPTPKLKKEKPLTQAQLHAKKRLEKIRENWRSTNPGLLDTDIDAVLLTFDGIKNTLRPVNPAPGSRNMPEMLALKQRFNNFPVEDVTKIRDAENYTWQEMEFLLDRFNEADNNEEQSFEIDGDTPEIRRMLAEKVWTKQSNKIVDENNLIVYKIESRGESIALGQLQNIMASEYGGGSWCVTMKTGGYYNSYRNRRAFYFVMDKNKDIKDRYYISALQAVDPNCSPNYQSERSFVITPRPNGDETGKSWDQVVSIYPGLRGKENIIKWFGQTAKERTDITLDSINFRENDPNYFGIIAPRLQQAWVDAGRLINSPKAFSMMKATTQTDYVKATTVLNYKDKYKSSNTGDAFGMLNILSKQDYKTLDWTMKNECKIPAGINAIKAAILRTNYKVSYTDIHHPDVMMFGSRSDANLFGILDLKTLNWLRDIKYMKGKTTTLFDRENRKVYILQRYSNTDGNDYFYWFFPKENLTSREKAKTDYMKGEFFNGEDGDTLSNKYQKLGE
jgi:hypothetical protein